VLPSPPKQNAFNYGRRANVDEVAAAIRGAVAQEHELEVYAVVLIRPARIPKTTSGKIQRYACRKAFLEGTLPEVAPSPRHKSKLVCESK
jgi:acyl-coenzyme A synthetase/AMP-(fatty) acid ligase